MAERTTFGALLARLRRQQGRTQLQLAGDAGVSAKHISFLETGRAHPTRNMILRLAAAIQLSNAGRDRLLLAAGYASCMQDDDLPVQIQSTLAVSSFEQALSIVHAATIDDAMKHAGRVLESFGLVHFFAGVLTPAVGGSAARIQVHRGGRPPVAWLAHYDAAGYRRVDPLVRATARSHRSFFWHDIVRGLPLSRQQHRMFGEAGEFRIGGGFVVPIRWADGRVHAVSSMGRQIEARDPTLPIVVRTVCTSLLERLELSSDSRFIEQTTPQLPPRTVRYLQAVGRGMTIPAISDQYKRPTQEVRAAITDACVALGVTDERQAVLRASRYRLIEL